MSNVSVVTDSVYRNRPYIDETDRRAITHDELIEILNNPDKYDGEEFILCGYVRYVNV
jgi:hypothetical protein